MVTFLFVICLMFSIWFGFVNIGKVCHRQSVSEANCIIMALALACTIVMCIHGWY